MKKGYTHISVVLDKSGSMASCLNDTIGGFNQFIKTQKEVKGEATITLVQFNTNYDLIMDMVELNNTEDLNIRNYSPNGYTALLDAIGRTINNVESKIEEKKKKDRPEKVIFVIITDGEENSSREFNHSQIMEMINNHRSNNNWEFVFIGANQDSIQSGGSIGVRAGNTLDYSATPQGTQVMYSSLTKSMTSYRSNNNYVSDSFFQNEEEKKDEFLKNPKGPLQNMRPPTTTNTK